MDIAGYPLFPLSLHDALPISRSTCGTTCSAPTLAFTTSRRNGRFPAGWNPARSWWGADKHEHPDPRAARPEDRKSTRLNSSHVDISYAVFCLNKKISYYVHPV